MSQPITADPRVGGVQPGPLPRDLLALAPFDLPNHRTIRYKGDDQYVPADSLSEQKLDDYHRPKESLTGF